MSRSDSDGDNGASGISSSIFPSTLLSFQTSLPSLKKESVNSLSSWQGRDREHEGKEEDSIEVSMSLSRVCVCAKTSSLSKCIDIRRKCLSSRRDGIETDM